MQTAVAELLKRSTAIPSMPQVAARFLEIVQDQEFDYGEVVEVLSADAGIASDVLKLANSSLFGVTRRVSSLPHALTLLGVRRVRSLVLGRYIVQSIDRKSHHRIDTSYFWQRSLASAVISGTLVGVLEPELQEEGFISGLLADVGVIVLDEVMASDYEPISSEYHPSGQSGLAKREVDHIGISHGEASAIVLERWQLPDIVCEAVRWHPWELEEPQASPLARIVGAADLLGKYLCEDQEDLAGVISVCDQIAETLHIGCADLGELLLQIEPQIEEFAKTLGIDVVRLDVTKAVAATLRDRLLGELPTTA